jgi:hypothetical protein
VRTPRDSRRCVVITVLALSVGCARPARLLAPDPDVTFSLHREAGRLVIDRLPSGETAALASPGWLHDPDAPSFTLEWGHEPHAALWIVGRSRVLVRSELSTTAPRTAEVVPAWDEGAIRLTLFQTGGPTLRTDRFTADDGRSVLSRAPNETSALEGTFRAAARDGAGTPVGWLRVRLEPPATPVYDGVLPLGTDDALAVAAALALDAEVVWLGEHAGR